MSGDVFSVTDRGGVGEMQPASSGLQLKPRDAVQDPAMPSPVLSAKSDPLRSEVLRLRASAWGEKKEQSQNKQMKDNLRYCSVFQGQYSWKQDTVTWPSCLSWGRGRGAGKGFLKKPLWKASSTQQLIKQNTTNQQQLSGFHLKIKISWKPNAQMQCQRSGSPQFAWSSDGSGWAGNFDFASSGWRKPRRNTREHAAIVPIWGRLRGPVDALKLLDGRIAESWGTVSDKERIFRKMSVSVGEPEASADSWSAASWTTEDPGQTRH